MLRSIIFEQFIHYCLIVLLVLSDPIVPHLDFYDFDGVHNENGFNTLDRVL